jgi:chitinase
VKDAKGLTNAIDVQVVNKAPKANQAPVVNPMESITLQAGETYALHAQAADPDGDALTYAWSVPADMNATGTDTANVNITAPAVASDSTYTLSVVVSDGKTSVQSNVQVIVTPKAADEVTPPSDEVTPPADEVTPPSDEGSATGSCDAPVDASASQYPAWSASKIYNSGDTVSADNLVWKAKYWTQGNKPGFDADAWELVSQVKMNWRSDVVYNGGDTTTYQGYVYRAKWWTRGDKPGNSDVWVKEGASADCK